MGNIAVKIKRSTMMIFIVCSTFILSRSKIYDYLVPKLNGEKYCYFFPIMFSAYFFIFSIVFTDDVYHFTDLWIKKPWIKKILIVLLHICEYIFALFTAIPSVIDLIYGRARWGTVWQDVETTVKNLNKYSTVARSMIPAGLIFLIIAPLFCYDIITKEELNRISEWFDFAFSLVALWLLVLNIKAKYNTDDNNLKKSKINSTF